MISKTLDDTSQRDNLFHTKFLVKGGLCIVLIDSVSCANVSSAIMVDFLKLPTTPHASSYKLQWLNECRELKVTRQCVIRFKVRNYHDEVLCYVISMQACHLLLGRPWQYDKSTKHGRRTNQYSFELNGRKFTLHPLSPSQVNELHQQMRELKEKGKKAKKEGKPKSGKREETKRVSTSKGKNIMVIFARKREFFLEHDDNTRMLLLANIFNTNLSNISIPHSISLVLQEFEDVFPKELP
ncbi:uncharacterized protein LOC124885744 [Capsicum annuum]|uniref:uncharacterized protein LOC124885744 n=1 Tax=Capsicum annuum TaxID=4072 RepID=UPI001FB178E6|nr:uncharacterized protein LOC124885744 [Capsicum annuum]